MKKFTAILLTMCVMSVAFVGCNDTTTTKDVKKVEKTETKTAPKTP